MMEKAGSGQKLYTRMRLWEFPNQYVIEPTDGSSGFPLAVSRVNGTLSLIGTRMWRRGADSDGYVANFVESEQLMQINGFTASFVQFQGSIPFPWEQIVDLTYKPVYEIVQPEEAVSLARR